MTPVRKTTVSVTDWLDDIVRLGEAAVRKRAVDESNHPTFGADAAPIGQPLPGGPVVNASVGAGVGALYAIAAGYGLYRLAKWVGFDKANDDVEHFTGRRRQYY